MFSAQDAAPGWKVGETGMSDKDRIITFLQQLIPDDFKCGKIECTFADDESLIIHVANKEDEPTFKDWIRGEGR